MVKIIVLVKQVFQTADLKVDRSTKTIVTQGVPRVISEADKNAVEEAVRIKEKDGGHVAAITLGPPEAKEALREALAMGADEGYLLTDRVFEGSDAHATANVLAAAVTKILEYDLILCGAYSEDLYSFQVGSRLAEICNLPQITYAAKLTLTGGGLVAERDLESERQVVEAKLPCLVTVVREINEPRLPTLMAIMAASKKPMHTWNAADLSLAAEEAGFNGSLIEVLRSTVSAGERKRITLQGEPQEIASKLVKTLAEEGVLTAS